MADRKQREILADEEGNEYIELKPTDDFYVQFISMSRQSIRSYRKEIAHIRKYRERVVAATRWELDDQVDEGLGLVISQRLESIKVLERGIEETAPYLDSKGIDYEGKGEAAVEAEEELEEEVEV